jgi:hypothetical protein
MMFRSAGRVSLPRRLSRVRKTRLGERPARGRFTPPLEGLFFHARGYGRPVQAVQSEVKRLDISKLYIAAMKKANARDEGANAIDGAAIERTKIDREEVAEDQ